MKVVADDTNGNLSQHDLDDILEPDDFEEDEGIVVDDEWEDLSGGDEDDEDVSIAVINLDEDGEDDFVESDNGDAQ